MVKVCMIVPQADVKGGIATVVNGYRKYGLGEGYELSFVESYCDGSKWDKLEKAICGYVKFAKELLVRRPDIVHVHSSFGPSFYRKIPFIYMAKLRGVKLINHIHGAELDKLYTNSSGMKIKLVKKIYNKCDVLLVLSQEWKDKISEIIDEEKIEIVENYCHIPQVKKSVRKNQILFLGAIGERKGCFDIPDIYQKVVEKAGMLPLIMAGDGEVEIVKSMLEQRKLLDNVSFPGWIRGEEKEKLLEESSYFLFPSYNEGMPMAVLEAMAYGMGIVTSDVGGIPKLIENGISGYICTPGNVEDFAESMIQLILNEEKLKMCGSNARRVAIEKYSYESHVGKVLKVYAAL